MSGESPVGSAGGRSGSYSRGRRVGGWNSDSPPGLTATPNGGGGTCGTRRGNGGGNGGAGDPEGSPPVAAPAGPAPTPPGPPASVVPPPAPPWSGTAPDRRPSSCLVGAASYTLRDELALTVSENTDPAAV